MNTTEIEKHNTIIGLESEANRRVVIYNSIKGECIFVVEGLLSMIVMEERLSVTVKVGPNQYKKHYFRVSDNVTWFCEQIEPTQADPYYYKAAMIL